MTEMTFVRADRLRLTTHPTLNDAWLRERVVDDPSVLGLGDLRLADEGRLRDGRLELLLRDPATGRRFTVLVRVGPAEEADLVRAIEHWTIERARYPEHDHFAVIVAEEMSPRFLSAANTLGGTIPLSALQVSALSVAGQVALHFTVVVDRLPARTAEHVNGKGVTNGKANGNGAADVRPGMGAGAETSRTPGTSSAVPNLSRAQASPAPEASGTMPNPPRAEAARTAEASGAVPNLSRGEAAHDGSTSPSEVVAPGAAPVANADPALTPATAAARAPEAQSASTAAKLAPPSNGHSAAAPAPHGATLETVDAPAIPAEATRAGAVELEPSRALFTDVPGRRTDVKLPDWLSDEPAEEQRHAARPRGHAGGGGRLFSLLCAVSLLLCGVAVAGWVRSHWVRDEFTFADRGGGDHVVYSDHGRLDWISPAAGPGGGQRFVRIPYWLPAGITAILPAAWLIRRRGRAQEA